ncbi:hypothetical protein N9V68_01760 [Octadecabacter sp.]|nr:hypothetical protein [Octadecabacter sp.]
MPALQFSRRPCVIGGQTAPNDWSIFVNGKKIGRVLFYNKGATGTHCWQWSVTTYPSKSGQTESLEQAPEQIKAVVPPLVIDGELQMSGKTAHRLFSRIKAPVP